MRGSPGYSYLVKYNDETVAVFTEKWFAVSWVKHRFDATDLVCIERWRDDYRKQVWDSEGKPIRFRGYVEVDFGEK